MSKRHAEAKIREAKERGDKLREMSLRRGAADKGVAVERPKPLQPAVRYLSRSGWKVK